MDQLPESRWLKAIRHARWGRPLELATNAVVMAGAGFALLGVALVIFFGLIYGW